MSTSWPMAVFCSLAQPTLKGIPGGEALFQGSQYLGQTPTDKSKLDPKQRYMQSVIDSEQSRSMRSTGQPLSDDQLARLNHDLMINMQEIDKIGTKEDTGSEIGRAQ